MKWLPFFSWPFSETNVNWKMPAVGQYLQDYPGTPAFLYYIWNGPQRRKFLAPQVIDEIYDRLQVLPSAKTAEGKYSGLDKKPTFIIVKNNRRPAVIFWRGLRRI